MAERLEPQLNALVLIALTIGVMFALLGLKDYNSIFWSWAASFLAGFITTAAIQTLIQKVFGEKLDVYLLNIKVGDNEYSVSVIIILSVIYQWLMF